MSMYDTALIYEDRRTYGVLSRAIDTSIPLYLMPWIDVPALDGWTHIYADIHPCSESLNCQTRYTLQRTCITVYQYYTSQSVVQVNTTVSTSVEAEIKAIRNKGKNLRLSPGSRKWFFLHWGNFLRCRLVPVVVGKLAVMACQWSFMRQV
jgi:hypothetical protein